LALRRKSSSKWCIAYVPITGRPSERWFRGVIAAGLSKEQYVETVSTAAHVVAIDTMARGLGVDELALLQEQPGLPSQYRHARANRVARRRAP